MGMYDNVNNVFAKRIIDKCPMCSGELYRGTDGEVFEWQTKDFDCLLDNLDVEDVTDTFEMHTICPQCHRYISANVNMLDGMVQISTNTSSSSSRFNDLSLVDEYCTLKQEKYKQNLQSKIQDGFEQATEKDIINTILEQEDDISIDEAIKLIPILLNNYYIFKK